MAVLLCSFYDSLFDRVIELQDACARGSELHTIWLAVSTKMSQAKGEQTSLTDGSSIVCGRTVPVAVQPRSTKVRTSCRPMPRFAPV